MGHPETDEEMQRLRAELELLRYRFNLLVEHSSEAIFVKDVASRYVYANEAAAGMMFRRPDELVGQDDTSVFSPDVVREIRADDAHVMTSGQTVAIRTTRVLSNGVRMDYVTVKRPWINEEGWVVGIVGTTRNVTDVVEAQREAAAAAESFRSLVEAVAELVLVHQDGCVVYANPGAVSVLGRTEAGLAGTALPLLVRPQDRALLGRPGGLAVEVGFVRPDGRVRLVEVTEVGASWFGQPARFTIGRDVSARRTMQRQLQDADRLAAVGMLAGGVAHEIKNPLTFVLGAVRSLAETAVPPERARLGDVIDAAERIGAIVEGISGLARPDPPGAGAVDLEQVIDRALLLAGPRLRDRAEIVRTRAESSWVVGTDRRLVQVLVNLLVNAAQAIESGPKIGRVELGTALEGGALVLRIRDSGTGVSEEVARHLFEPFETTKASGEGTGLGLWISSGIVSGFGGSLVLENPGECGACFRLSLPLAAAPTSPVPVTVAAPARSTPSAAGSAQRARVLLVDDEPLITSLLAESLAGTFTIEVRSGVEEALVRLGEEPYFDLVLCDLIMPAGGGPRVYEAVQRLGELRPVMLFMSGGAANPEVRSFLVRKQIVPIDKPFRIAEVKRRLLEALAATRR